MSTTVVFKSPERFQIMAAKHALEAESIEYFEINKTDSAYVGLFGYIELYVHEEDVAQARDILASLEFGEEE